MGLRLGAGALVAANLVVLAAAAYELADALGWIALGDTPNDGPPGEGWLVAAAFVAMLLSGIAAVGAAIGGGRHARWPWASLPIVSVALVAARFFAYDPYYLPGPRRISDGASGRWIIVVAFFCVLAALLVALRRRVGLPVVGFAVIVCAFATAYEGTGH